VEVGTSERELVEKGTGTRDWGLRAWKRRKRNSLCNLGEPGKDISNRLGRAGEVGEKTVDDREGGPKYNSGYQIQWPERKRLVSGVRKINNLEKTLLGGWNGKRG